MFLEESRDTKSESFFRNSCFHNGMDNLCVSKIELSSLSHGPKLCSKKVSGDLFLAIKIKQQKNIAKSFPGVAKSWRYLVVQRWQLPPHATLWLRAWMQGFPTSSLICII